jgi:hypothetical protein
MLLILRLDRYEEGYRPVETEERWRKRSNDDLEKLMRGEDIVKYIRAQRTKWWGHLNRVERTKVVRNITEWNPIGM